MNIDEFKKDSENSAEPHSKDTDDLKFPLVLRGERKSTGDRYKFVLINAPVTPTSTLFLSPCNSPKYADLNNRLKLLY